MLFERKSKSKMTNIDYKQVGQLLQHLGMITQQINQGIAIIDLNGVICFINMPWSKMHGYKTTNELLGERISIFHNQEQLRIGLNPLIEQSKCTGRSEGMVEHMRADGATFPTCTKMILLKNERGKANGFLVITTDITEHKRLEEKAIEANKRGKELEDQIEELEYKIQTQKYIKVQADELRAVNDKLKQQITDYERSEENFKQQIAESKAANEQLKAQIDESEKARKKLIEQFDELKNTPDEIRYETKECIQKQEVLRTGTENIEKSEKQIKSSEDMKMKEIVKLANQLR